MKKILSVILMLAMLIAPAGAVSCFADGRRGTEAMADLEEADLDKILISVILNIDGSYRVNFDLLGRGEEFLKTIVVPEGIRLGMVENMFAQLHIREKMIELESCMVYIMIESYVNGPRRTFLTFFNSQQRIINIMEASDGINVEQKQA